MLEQQLQKDYLIAMKNKEGVKKLVLNYVLSQIKNKHIELQKDLDDSEVITILKKEVKAINESIGFLEKAGKKEALAEEQEKKVILESYLPQTLNHEQTKKLIETLISELQIKDLSKERGILMKGLMAKHKSEIDGSLVNEIINSML